INAITETFALPLAKGSTRQGEGVAPLTLLSAPARQVRHLPRDKWERRVERPPPSEYRGLPLSKGESESGSEWTIIGVAESRTGNQRLDCIASWRARRKSGLGSPPSWAKRSRSVRAFP